jgi:hypothetical protein
MRNGSRHRHSPRPDRSRCRSRSPRAQSRDGLGATAAGAAPASARRKRLSSSPAASVVRGRHAPAQPYVQLQTLFDAAWPPGRLYYIKSSVVRRLEEAAIDKYLDCARTMPTPLSAIAFQQLHGAASRVRSDDTAFPHRFDHYNLYIHPATDDPTDATKIRVANAGMRSGPSSSARYM